MGNKFGDAYREEQRRIHRRAMQPRREPRGGRRSHAPEPQQPRYEQPMKPANDILGTIISAAMGIFGAWGDGGSLASGAMPGHVDDAYGNIDHTAQTLGRHERTRRLRDMQDGTTDHGNRTGWSSER